MVFYIKVGSTILNTAKVQLGNELSPHGREAIQGRCKVIIAGPYTKANNGGSLFNWLNHEFQVLQLVSQIQKYGGPYSFENNFGQNQMILEQDSSSDYIKRCLCS